MSSVTITWTTNEPSTSQVDYGLDTSYGLSSIFDPTLLIGHSVTVAGLTPGTTYHYRVRSQDASGNLAISTDHTVDTFPAAQAPMLTGTALLMKSWLPEMWYARAKSSDGIMNAEGTALDQLETDIRAVQDARLPETADTWGLLRLEDETGIGERSDMEIGLRRQRLIGHFRGIGSTIARLETIAQSWGAGRITIVPDPEAYTLYIKFVDQAGVPADIDSHQVEMRANVQAHLAIIWQFGFLTWAGLKASGSSWANIKNQGVTWEGLKTWVPTATGRTATPVTVAVSLSLIQRTAHPVTVSLL